MSKLPLDANWVMRRTSGNRGVIRHSMRLALSIVLVVACVLPAGCIFKVSDNISPFAPAIAVYPSQPDTTDDLHCLIISPSVDPDGDTVTYSYGWYKDGTLQPELTGDSVNSEYTAGGEVWRVEATGSDGITGSATGSDELTISDEVSIGGGDTYNSPPTAPVVKVIPELPATADDQLCSIVTPSTDSDGDAVTYTYQWYKDGVLQDGLSTNKVDSSYTAENQVWKCVVTASDGMDSSDASFASVIVQNSAPYSPVVAITPSAPISTDDLVCNIETQSSDPDGDDLTYIYQWYRDGVLQDSQSTNKVDSSYTAEHQVWKCVVTASDGTNSGDSASCSVVVGADVYVAAHDSSQADKDRADHVCDGSHDEAQIQAAIDSLASGGGTIFIAEGTYFADSTIRVEMDDIRITGEGHIVRSFAGDGLFYIRLCDNFLMEGLELEDTSDHYYSLVRIEGCTNVDISNNVLHDMRNGIWLFPDSDSGTKSSDINIAGNEIYNFGYAAIMLNNGCEHINISGNEIHDGSRVNLASPYLYAIASDQIGGRDPDMPMNEWISITDNVIYNLESHNAIDMHGENHLEIRGNHISNVEATAIYVHTNTLIEGIVDEIYDWQVADNVIEGCYVGVQCVAECGITVHDIVVSGNTVKEFENRAIRVGTDSYIGSNFHGVEVSGNVISAPAGDQSVGIRVSGRSGQVSSSDFVIANNVIFEVVGSGYFERAIMVYYMDYGTIEGNEISGIPESAWYGVYDSTNVLLV